MGLLGDFWYGYAEHNMESQGIGVGVLCPWLRAVLLSVQSVLSVPSVLSVQTRANPCKPVLNVHVRAIRAVRAVRAGRAGRSTHVAAPHGSDQP